MCGMLWWDAIKDTYQSWPTSCQAERTFVDTKWFASRVHWYSNCIISQQTCCCSWWAVTLWTLFKYSAAIGDIETFLFELLMNSCAKFDLLFVNIQCAIAFSLEKWTLKFRLLYLLNHVSYLNRIWMICCVNTIIPSESLAQISTSMAEIQNFSMGLFFIGTLCRLNFATNKMLYGEKCA